MNNSLQLLWHFLRHMVFGTLIFVGVAVTALLLHLFTNVLESNDFPEYFVIVLRGLEILVFSLDAILYILFVVRETLKLGKEIWMATR